MFFLPTTSVVVVIRDTSTTVNKLSVTGRLMMDPFVIAEGLLKTRRNAHDCTELGSEPGTHLVG